MMERARRMKYAMVIPVLFAWNLGSAQPAPAEDENIPYLVTFGNQADKSWGDDDFCQIFFFRVPESYKDPFYIRIYDPDTGGELDEAKGTFNTSTSFSVYGGTGTWTNEDAKQVDPVGNFKSGNLLGSRTFSSSSRYDEEWYSLGPFMQTEGEYVEQLGGLYFQINHIGTRRG